MIDIFATIENQRSSHKGTCFDAVYPVEFDTNPTNAVTAKWNPVNVVAGERKMTLNKISHDSRQYTEKKNDSSKKLRNKSNQQSHNHICSLQIFVYPF